MFCVFCTLYGSFSGTISLNAAIFTAVLLGSRLQSNEHVFAFVLLAIEIFAMFPIFQREIKVRLCTAEYMRVVAPTSFCLFVFDMRRICSAGRSGCTS